MHVILGALGLIVTILVLVRRLADAGIDIGWLDPFKWHRRQQWRKHYHADPVYSIDDPMKATAGLMYTMVKCTGDISKEEKEALLKVFTEDFKLSEREAADLLSTCSFHLRDEDKVRNNLRKYLAPSLGYFAEPQKESALSLIEKVACCEGGPNEKQAEFFEEIGKVFRASGNKRRAW